ncbi:unnamed protein product [Cuscuta epithymum]|uniref:SAWADEE domain-containing protein n=1 Tax=Cuscuta epithymum TaxID=186058 RepID=A0AAV0FN01_9ASTE|nr:unnamed protein product [Cuscuta epithymum]
MRYYDAIVEAVDRKAHSCVNEEEEEECRCTFVLSWLHGPNTGLLTSASIASVCTVNDEGQIDPKVTYFSRLAKSKVAASSRKSTSIYPKEASAGLVLAKGGRKLLTDQKNFSFQGGFSSLTCLICCHFLNTCSYDS